MLKNKIVDKQNGGSVAKTRPRKGEKAFLIYVMLFYFVSCIVINNVVFAQDVYAPSRFDPLTWEEHFFVNEDKSVFSILIITFSVNDLDNETVSEDNALNIILHTEKTINVYLYPNSEDYEGIEKIYVSTENSFSDITHPVNNIRVVFNEEINIYQRFSFALLLEMPDIIETDSPFLRDAYHYFDYTIWINDSGDAIDSVPAELFSYNIEGDRFEEEFRRITVTLPEDFRLNDINPTDYSRSKKLPYSYGINSEKRDGYFRPIVVGFSQARRFSPIARLEAGERMTWKIESLPYNPDATVSEIIGDTLQSTENIYTLGWTQPPSTIYIETATTDNARLVLEIIGLIGGLGGIISLLYWIWTKIKKIREDN